MVAALPCLQVCHIPDFVRMYGSILKYSTQALESLHARHKQIRRFMGTAQTGPRDCLKADATRIAVRLERIKSRHGWDRLKTEANAELKALAAKPAEDISMDSSESDQEVEVRVSMRAKGKREDSDDEWMESDGCDGESDDD